MQAKSILLMAVLLGAIGGYGWSSLTATAARAPASARATIMPLPASPEERPGSLDEEWTLRSGDEPPPATRPVPTTAPVQSVHYSGCNDVRAAGKAPLHAGQPGYRADMDGDGDGIACEPYRGN